MQKSRIEWCSYTSNPVKGYCPVGCSYCYARKTYDRFKWDKTIRFVPEELLEWGKAKAGSKIFVGSTIELFHDETIQYMPKIMDAIRTYPHLRILLLTKQPQNLIKWSPFTENCWVGVTICNDKMLDVAVDKLEDIQATHKFFSFEPLQKRLSLSLDYALYYSGVSWLIIGQQTPVSKKTEPKIEWIRNIVEAADKAGIPVFLKDNILEFVNYKSPETDFAFNKEGCYRQEFPK